MKTVHNFFEIYFDYHFLGATIHDLYKLEVQQMFHYDFKPNVGCLGKYDSSKEWDVDLELIF